MRYLFNKSITSIPASASLAINEKAKAMRAAGKDVITLAAGEPDFDTPDRARVAGIRAISEGHTHYTESRGIRPLREGIARMLEPHPVKRTEKKYKVFPVSSRALLAVFYAARQSACFSIGVSTPRLRWTRLVL